jgi:hypothetical protein
MKKKKKMDKIFTLIISLLYTQNNLIMEHALRGYLINFLNLKSDLINKQINKTSGTPVFFQFFQLHSY